MRDEIDANLGYGLSSKLLKAMCRYRLGPTPWLNQVCWHWHDTMFHECTVTQSSP